MTPHPIEIKVNIGGDVDDALAALGPLPRAKKRRIWFVEDSAGVASGELNLLSQNVILRARSGADAADSTAKLRPVTINKLIGQWAPHEPDIDGVEYKIERDWSASGRVIAASAGVEHSASDFAAAVEAGNLAPVFTSKQRQLVRECADVDIDSLRLQHLRPIASSKWEKLVLGRVEKINAERWSVLHLDFLELSIVVKPGDDESEAALHRRAEKAERSLLDAAADVGLQPDDSGETKTRRVLHELVLAQRRDAETVATQRH